MAYESREEIDSKYKWDLSSMFPSDEAFEAGLEELKAYCPKLLAFKGKISTSAQALLEFLLFCSIRLSTTQSARVMRIPA